MTGVALGFIPEPLSVPITSILPSRRTPAGMMNSRKFKQIISSIEEVGLIEPLSVTPVDQASGNHVLLDGHLRLIALQELQFNTVSCLVATDDESYTYNNRVNRLSTIQEHFMIRRAVERGVSPERLAKALSVDVSQIIKRMALLDGICAEATELLKDRQFSPELARAPAKDETDAAGRVRGTDGGSKQPVGLVCRSVARRDTGFSTDRRQETAEACRREPRANGEDGAGDEQSAGTVQGGRADLWTGRAQPRARKGLPC
ncbi:parB-like nuclease domain protein [Burkholderia pseudomallei ABCPW 107]|nr:parB-like nuclease domain protein [Burkholderia pseudomallei ABCPW 107]